MTEEDIFEKVKNRPESFMVKSDTEISIGRMTEHDWNKQIMEQFKPLSEIKIKKKIQKIVDWFFAQTFNQSEQHYFLLLGWEHRYFTFFAKEDVKKWDNYSFNKNLYECLTSLGNILDIYYNKQDNSYEFWIRDENKKPAFYKLFCCDELVVKY